MTNYTLPSKIDLSRVILWQYANAERLIGLVKLLEESSELTTVGLWKLINQIFDLDNPITENDDLDKRELGLNIIASLFGIKIPDIDVDGITRIEKLNAIRRYIKGALYLIDSDGSIPELNTWAKMIVPESNVYIQDNLDMTLSYVIPATMSELDKAMLKLLPRPAGVILADEVELVNKTLSLDLGEGIETPDDVDTLNNAHFTEEKL